MTTYVVGGGCFWCIDAVFRRLKGVSNVESGYSNGEDERSPNYYRVASGRTGYVEVVRVTFDETVIPSDVILDLFFLLHNPTTLNQQGADIGTQYRSTLLFSDKAQQVAFKAARDRAQKVWQQNVVTEIAPLESFFVAESEHQDFYNKQPESGYCQIVIEPKIAKARQQYLEWFEGGV